MIMIVMIVMILDDNYDYDKETIVIFFYSVK